MRTVPPSVKKNIIYDEAVLKERWDACLKCEFLTESKGQLFVAKQFFLQAFNADSNTRIYNPLSLVTSLPNNVSQNRHIDTGDGSIGGFLGGVIGLPRKKKNGKGAVTLFSKDRKRKLQVSMLIKKR